MEEKQQIRSQGERAPSPQPPRSFAQEISGQINRLHAPPRSSVSHLSGQQRKKHILLLVALTVLCLLPFISKPFNMDDPLFVWTAENIQHHPLDPYGFSVNWYGRPMQMSDVNKNPPLAAYYAAAVASVFGSNELALHIAFLLPAIFVIAGTYLIACRYCRNPLLAGITALSTPVFLISGTTVMSDMPMLAFWVFAVYFWMKGLEKKSDLTLAFSALLVTASCLTKYFGITLIPLLLMYAIFKLRSPGRYLVYMMLPVVILAGYQFASTTMYGRGLLLDAAAYAFSVPSAFGKLSLAKVLVGLSFTGGCTFVVLCVSHLTWSRTAIAIGVSIWLVLAIGAAVAGSLGAYQFPAQDTARAIISIELGLFISGGISLLAIGVLDFIRNRDADSGLLFLWFMGTFLFAAFINWTTAGRSILPLVPAAAILIVRRIEMREALGNTISRTKFLIPIVCAAIVGLLAARGDYRLADSVKTASAEIVRKYGSAHRTIWFSGHWGFQYYMQLYGANPIVVRSSVVRSALSPGDIFVMPHNNTNAGQLPPQMATLREILEMPSGWITTMHPDTSAGFYADTWGPLPFAIGIAPLERYSVSEVK